MQTRDVRARRVLVVMERGLDLPSAMIAGLQYRELFAQQPDYDVSYVSLLVPPGDILDRIAPLLRRLRLHRLLAWLEARRLRTHQERILDRAADCDVVFEIKIPQVQFHRRLLKLKRPRILFCFADGLWLPFFRKGGWDHLEELLSTSHGITCESDYLERFARRFNQNVFRVNDAPQVEEFDMWRGRVARNPDKVVIGWVGSPATACALFSIWEPLEDLFARFPHLELRILGGDPATFPRFEKVRWTALPSYDQQTMIMEVLAMDIGLFPLFNVEESLARGILKPMIYMSGGAAAVCQDLGDIREIIKDGVNGILAGSHDEWKKKLEWLIEHPQQRREIAERGVQTVRERFSRRQCFEQLVYAIEHV